MLINWVEKNLVDLSKFSMVRKYFGGRFSRAGTIKALVVYAPNRISYCQIYPFLYYRKHFLERYNVEFRFVSCESLEHGYNTPCRDADVVLFETWFTIRDDELRGLVARLKENNPNARLHYVDSFAPTDLRLSRILCDDVDSYIKKSVLDNRELYKKPMAGGTNLTEYYANLYSIDLAPVDWQVPSEILPKLKLSPTFFTGPDFLEDILLKELPFLDHRAIDLHARLATKGSDWYQAMRQHSEEAVKSLSGLNIMTGVGVSRKQFIDEMRRSKLCFSPFGYGEICWRDIEAIVTGCILVKPDMSHLEMAPDIHIAGETYISVKWDFSDLDEKIRPVLEDEGLRRSIANNAFQMLKDYMLNERFVSEFGYLFPQ